MAYTETTTTSYGTRLKNSVGGVFTGFLMFIIATCLLWWNEGRAVKTTKMLEEAQGNYVEMKDINTVDPALNGKLVHATGLATTKDTLVDDYFGIRVGAIALQRKVEYYQWVETAKQTKRDKLGGSEETVTTYTYHKDWRSQPENSAEFHDPSYRSKNFVLADLKRERWDAKNVSFGAYQLSESQVKSLSTKAETKVVLSDEKLRGIDEQIVKIYKAKHGDKKKETTTEKTAANDSVAQNPGNTYAAECVHVQGNTVYLGMNAGSPEIGDVRVTYSQCDPGDVSIIAVANGKTFSSYTAKNGKQLSVIRHGVQTADQMFTEQHEGNSMLTWVLRIIGILLVISGLRGILGIAETLLKVIPFVANIFAFGVSLICGVLGFVWSLLVIALAWIFYRPLIGILLLAVVGAVIFAFSSKGKKLIAEKMKRS